MPKKIIERFMPKPETLRNHKHLQMFGKLLHKPNLWALNRRSAPMAFAVGLFVAWIPMPFQMVFAAALAIIFNCNLPIAVALVWVTNPVTMPFMFYAAYLFGAKLLSHPPQEFTFQASWQWIEASLSTIGPPFLLGCLAFAIIFATVGYFVVHNLWKYSILFKWKRKKRQY
ncbi:DUF2062 domain-containing protein [Shewanella algidipiscicola]|nr:DUF2062 domain-containing protein [Shewanella algidipiscicola]